MNGFEKYLIFGIVTLIFLTNLTFAETTCTKGDCELTITLKIAFQGATQDYMNRAEQEIESVWNGPNGHRTVGDCKCKMTFNVITKTAQDCKNNPPADYHCIMVTDYNNNPPRNQTNWTGAKFYIAYMYGVSSGNGGNSEKGWWSDIASRPVNATKPQGEHYKDFAHEAGHMMGLEDCDGGIMCRTWGANSNPTQDNLDEIANDICGADFCPARCCCGNGQIDGSVGENCDPMATPEGCGKDQMCCPVCCHCHSPLICIPALGEYFSEADCNLNCGPGSSCYYNYQTNCWDCVKQNVVVHDTCLDPTNIRGNMACDHVEQSFTDYTIDFYKTDLMSTPVLGGVFANERINVNTAEGDKGYVTTQGGEVVDYGEGHLADSTVTVDTDRQTVLYVAEGEMTAQQALSEGLITIQGNDFGSSLKFGFYNFIFGVYNFFNPPEEFVEPEMKKHELPQEYYDVMADWNEGSPADEETMGHEIGELPDDGYFGEDVYPY